MPEMEVDVPHDTTDTGEEGVALLSVMGITLVVLLLAGVAFNLAITSQRQAYDYEGYESALAAAEAGRNDYLARLNRIPNYYTTFNEGNPGDNSSLDGWAPVQEGTGEFHVDVDTSRANSEGAVIVRSTGRVGDAERTIETTFRPDGFLDFIYFTQFEIQDPSRVSRPASCNQFHSEGRSDGTCGYIRFVTEDRIQGPFHTNDAMVIDGNPTFAGEATTSFRGTAGNDAFSGCTSDSNRLWREDPDNAAGTSQPVFEDDLCWSETLDVPEDNTEIRQQTTWGPSVSTQGCIYYGPTYIRLDGDQMFVRSPFSGEAAAPDDYETNPACGTAAELDTGVLVDLPPNGVVYVDEASWKNCDNDPHPLDMPRPGDRTSGEYDCKDGDVFVWGELDGQLTIGADHNIYPVWDITYAGNYPETDDLLGLVANNDVVVYHPYAFRFVDDDGDGDADRIESFNLPVYDFNNGTAAPPFTGELPVAASRTWDDPIIHGALMAVRHSFRVQNHNRGQPYNSGDLSVRGAIAQFYRGAVGTSDQTTGDKASGYDKDYVYDDRLQYLSPPYFTTPGGDTVWSGRTWAELTPPGDLPPNP